MTTDMYVHRHLKCNDVRDILKNLRDGESHEFSVNSIPAEVWCKHNMLFLFEVNDSRQPSFDSAYGKHAIDYLLKRVQEWT